MSSASSPTSADRSRSTRSVSRSSSSTSSRHSLPISTVANGSTYIVAPVFDASCTIPGTRDRISAFTGTTTRSFRVVTSGSCSASRPDSERISRCSVSVTRSYARTTCRRSARSEGVASSATFPRASIFLRIWRRSSLRSGIPATTSESSGSLPRVLLTAPAARLCTSSESATDSSCVPVSTPPMPAIATYSDVSTARCRSTPPTSSNSSAASDVSRCSSSTSSGLYEGDINSASSRAGKNVTRPATSRRTSGKSSASIDCPRNSSLSTTSSRPSF